jgi:hypothetical protein
MILPVDDCMDDRMNMDELDDSMINDSRWCPGINGL